VFGCKNLDFTCGYFSPRRSLDMRRHHAPLRYEGFSKDPAKCTTPHGCVSLSQLLHYARDSRNLRSPVRGIRRGRPRRVDTVSRCSVRRLRMRSATSSELQLKFEDEKDDYSCDEHRFHLAERGIQPVDTGSGGSLLACAWWIKKGSRAFIAEFGSFSRRRAALDANRQQSSHRRSCGKLCRVRRCSLQWLHSSRDSHEACS
jgi:hypothetical protein